ncbi:ATP-dependent DNA helicase PIF1 [Senna tora]|uniref:ATP-dependent DNA helicase n=1 Tax=Senna tora TaxID=362788 RepID=A0A834W2T8_9FABA|nr:ATP-dependent DNA helicase PIF1 [Senna tora]
MHLKNYALIEIDKMLRNNGRTLKDFPPLSIPDCENQLNYDKEALAAESTHLISTMTNEQRKFLDEIIHSTSKTEGAIFFVHGYGGTRKAYNWKALTIALRSQGHIVFIVTSS